MLKLFQKIKSDGWLLIIFLAVVFVLAAVPVADYDTGYHLATGQYIVTHKAVPLYDIFSYTASGARWIAHYWLADVIFYLVYQLAGYWGLIVFVALMAAATYGILVLTVRLRSKNLPLTLFLMVPFVILTARTWQFWIIRPQIFGYLFATLLVFILEKWRLNRNKKFLYWLPPLFLLWGNLHASVVLGILIVLLYAGVHILRNLKELKTQTATLLVMFLSLGMALINPNDYRILTYSFYIAPVVKQLGIFEWQSIFSYLYTVNAWIEFGFIVLAGGLSVFWIVSDGFKKSVSQWHWEWLGLAAASLALSLLSVRHVGFFPILMLPVFAALADGFLKNGGFVWQPSRRGNLLLAAVGILLLSICVWQSLPFRQVGSRLLPVGAADFIKREKIQSPLFNTIGEGGYLIWTLQPDIKVFFDGRSEIYQGTALDDYQTITRSGTGWQDLFNNKYKINLAVLSSKVPAVKGEPVRADLVIAQKLVQEQKFKLVFWDDAALVLVRGTPENSEIIKNYGYEIIGPYITPQYISKKDAQKAAQEIERALKTSPDSEVIQRYARAFLETH